MIGRARFPDRSAGNLKAAMFWVSPSAKTVCLCPKNTDKFRTWARPALMRELSNDRESKAGMPGILVHFLDVGKSGAIGKIPRRLVKGRIPRRIGQGPDNAHRQT